jgi:hypothetical protein
VDGHNLNIKCAIVHLSRQRKGESLHNPDYGNPRLGVTRGYANIGVPVFLQGNHWQRTSSRASWRLSCTSTSLARPCWCNTTTGTCMSLCRLLFSAFRQPAMRMVVMRGIYVVMRRFPLVSAATLVRREVARNRVTDLLLQYAKFRLEHFQFWP